MLTDSCNHDHHTKRYSCFQLPARNWHSIESPRPLNLRLLSKRHSVIQCCVRITSRTPRKRQGGFVSKEKDAGDEMRQCVWRRQSLNPGISHWRRHRHCHRSSDPSAVTAEFKQMHQRRDNKGEKKNHRGSGSPGQSHFYTQFALLTSMGKKKQLSYRDFNDPRPPLPHPNTTTLAQSKAPLPPSQQGQLPLLHPSGGGGEKAGRMCGLGGRWLLHRHFLSARPGDQTENVTLVRCHGVGVKLWQFAKKKRFSLEKAFWRQGIEGMRSRRRSLKKKLKQSSRQKTAAILWIFDADGWLCTPVEQTGLESSRSTGKGCNLKSWLQRLLKILISFPDTKSNFWISPPGSNPAPAVILCSWLYYVMWRVWYAHTQREEALGCKNCLGCCFWTF